MKTGREAAFAYKEFEHKGNFTGDVIAQDRVDGFADHACSGF
jgi:hypothetical protein